MSIYARFCIVVLATCHIFEAKPEQAFIFVQDFSDQRKCYSIDIVEEIINIQPDGSNAKSYQVKQIRELMVKYRLEEKNE